MIIYYDTDYTFEIVDNCWNGCKGHPARPHTVVAVDKESLRAVFHCDVCGADWFVGYAAYCYPGPWSHLKWQHRNGVR